MFKFTDPSLRGEVYLNMNLGVLELKLQEVQGEAEENLSTKCTECSFNPNVKEEVAKYPDAELARRGVLGLPPS